MIRQIAVSILFLWVSAALVQSARAGPYSDALHGISYNDTRFVGWATGIDMHWPGGFVPGGGYDCTTRALGPAPGTSNDVVTFGDGGWAVLTFGRVIRNRPGPDLAVFENGFSSPGGGIFGELAFVEVSSDGVHYARFPSVSLNPWPGEYGGFDPTKVYNLAGKHVNNNDEAWLGTPFNLDDLENNPMVTSGLVLLDNVNYVKIIDIYGHSDGSTYDNATSLVDPTTGLPYTTNHVIYDGGNYGGLLAGFDLDAVGILESVPEPATVGLIVLAAGAATGSNLLHRRKSREKRSPGRTSS